MMISYHFTSNLKADVMILSINFKTDAFILPINIKTNKLWAFKQMLWCWASGGIFICFWFLSHWRDILLVHFLSVCLSICSFIQSLCDKCIKNLTLFMMIFFISYVLFLLFWKSLENWVLLKSLLAEQVNWDYYNLQTLKVFAFVDSYKILV